MNQEDFMSIMKEVVPPLIDQAMESDACQSSHKHSSAETERSESAEPPVSRPRTLATEALSVEDCDQLMDVLQQGSHETLMSEYLKKKMSKELPHSNNPPEIQKLVDEGKKAEWETILSKPYAVKIHYGKQARRIREQYPDRFIGSRFVLTRKPIEEGCPIDPHDIQTFRVKGRWCLQGHLDPDMLKSPTLSQLGRMTLMQVISSMHWKLQLGDIKGAFLEAGPIESRFRPLYASQPAGGIPGLPSTAVIEVCGKFMDRMMPPQHGFESSHLLLVKVDGVKASWTPACSLSEIPSMNIS